MNLSGARHPARGYATGATARGVRAGRTRQARRWRVAALLVGVVAGCENGVGPGAERAFSAPIAGEPMVDIFYGAYMDHQPDSGAMDYECGIKAYDGHLGVDILLRSFREQDAGVEVIAAAPGMVVAVVDAVPDRNTSWDQGESFGNHVVLRHSDGVRTVYAHLRRHSILVQTGQSVGTGAVLGLVGSSGRSNWPHLHFEVWGPQGATEPFAGGCGPARSLWSDQPAYQNEFMVTDAGITDIEPLPYATLLERPPTVDQIPLNAEEFRFWIQLANQPAAVVRMEVHGPGGGDPAFAVLGHVGPSFSMRYLSTRVPVAGVLSEPGAWEVRTYQDEALIWSEPVTLVPAPADADVLPERAAPPPPADRWIEVHDQVPVR